MRYIFLAIPVVLALAVPLYNVVETQLWGIPFFWWFQLACVPLSAMFIMAAYLGDRK